MPRKHFESCGFKLSGKYKTEDINKIVILKRFIWEDNNYKTGQTLNLKCSKGHNFSLSVQRLKLSMHCPVCFKQRFLIKRLGEQNV